VSGELRGNFRVLAGGFTAFFFLNILNSSYSTVMALIKDELSLTYTMSGALMSAYFVGYTLGQVPWGLLADRYGSRRVMVSSILGIASASMFFSLSQTFTQAAVARFLAGLLGAGVFVPGVRLVSGWFPPDSRGTALGILSIGGSLGLILAGWVVPYTTLWLGWRGTLVSFGALGLLSTAAIWMTLKDRPSDTVSSPLFNGMADVFRMRSFWILALVQMARLGSNYALIAWLPLLLREEFGLDLVAAGAVFSLFNIAGMVSNPAGGFASDRMGEKRVIVASFAALGLTASLFTGMRAGISLYASVLVLGWFINFVRSPTFAIIPRLYGVERAGKVSGVQNTFASLGALIMPFIMGYVRDTTSSYTEGWTILSIVLLSVTLLSLLLDKTDVDSPD
jgi:nitrate/nitrite transporter NarK